MTVRDDCDASACNLPLLLSVKSLTPCLSGEGESQPLDRCLPPSPPVAGIWNKANFPFHQPGLFTGFWVVSNRTRHTYLSVTVWSFSLTDFSKSLGLLPILLKHTHCILLPSHLFSPSKLLFVFVLGVTIFSLSTPGQTTPSGFCLSIKIF